MPVSSVPPYVLGATEIRERVRATARGMVGIGPRSMDVYLRIVTPRRQRLSTAAQMGILQLRLPAASALVASGVLSCAGVVAEELDDATPGYEVTRFLRLARRYQGWYVQGVPMAGDVLALGPAVRKLSTLTDLEWLEGVSRSASQYVAKVARFAVVDAVNDGQMLTVEAGDDAMGESEPWKGTVRFCDRQMRYAHGAIWLVEGGHFWRRVAGYLDVDQLPFEIAP